MFLAGHYRHGRTYGTGFTAMDVFYGADWTRNDLPDLMIPICLLAAQGDTGIRNFVRAQTQVLKSYPELYDDPDCRVLDGRLTSIESVPEDHPIRANDRLHRMLVSMDAIPEQLPLLYHLYPEMPGAWLLVAAGSSEPSDAQKESALEFLSRAVYEVLADGHLEAMVKAVPLFWGVQSRQVSIDAQFHQLLRGYPNSAEPRLADTMIRASFGASIGRDIEVSPTLIEVQHRWAASFWRQNWALSECIPQELVESEQESGPDDEAGGDPETRTDRPEDDDGDNNEELQQTLIKATSALMNDFLRQTWSEADSIDLWQPAKHEVITGLISRAGRAVLAALQAPHTWNGEHLSDVSRKLVETEIYLTWMQLQDPAVYDRFQQFGIGKRKLNNAHLKATIAELPPDRRPPEVDAAVRHNESRMGGTWAEELIDVSTESFMGKTMRTMASDADLMELYNRQYQVLSGLNHGEWWAIEDYAMQRCLNILHRGHQIASLELFPTAPTAPQLLVKTLERIVHLAEDQLSPSSNEEETDGSPG